VHVTLVDRREKRTDALHRAVRTLGVESTTEIVCAEVETLVGNPSWKGRFDVAVSRGFGPPALTLTMSSVLVRSGGVVIISEPPVELPSRWSQELLLEAEVTSRERLGAVSMFHVEHR
jgi:16S rRNA (guanine527-N7)-methyltransferase